MITVNFECKMIDNVAIGLYYRSKDKRTMLAYWYSMKDCIESAKKYFINEYRQNDNDKMKITWIDINTIPQCMKDISKEEMNESYRKSSKESKKEIKINFDYRCSRNK